MSRLSGGTRLTSRLPKITRPEVCASRPAIICNAVVLPQPDGPSSTTNSPSAISRFSRSTAVTPPGYRLHRFSSTTRATMTSGISADAGPALERGERLVENVQPAIGERLGEHERGSDSHDRGGAADQHPAADQLAVEQRRLLVADPLLGV